MTKKQPGFIFLLSVLIFFALPSSGGVIQAHSVGSRQADIPTPALENLSFCQNVAVSKTGVICESSYGFTARLAFLQVDVERVLAGDEFFPNTESTYYVDNQVIHGMRY